MSERPHVLIIEDNGDLLQVLEQVLSGEYRVTTARRGEDGVTIARSEQPDVVILDLQLPGMDGIEAGRWMKRDRPTLPILVLTALNGEGEAEMVLRSGCCDAYMAKPAPLDVIRAKVAELLAAGARTT
jgi:DNA-binding response OmpR family regulator